MKMIICLILLSGNYLYAQSLPEIQAHHEARLSSIELKELNFYEKLIAKSLEKFGKGRLNKRLLNYLAVNESSILSFRKASNMASTKARRICGVSIKDLLKRHTDDEVDALRHLLWAGYLTLLLDDQKALAITSLQEDRPRNNLKSMQMDIWNNYQAINLVESHKKDILILPKQKQFRRVKELMLELFNAGEALVLISTETICQRKGLYPNFSLSPIVF